MQQLTPLIERTRQDLEGAIAQMGRVISDLRMGTEPRWEIPFSGEEPQPV